MVTGVFDAYINEDGFLIPKGASEFTGMLVGAAVAHECLNVELGKTYKEAAPVNQSNELVEKEERVWNSEKSIEPDKVDPVVTDSETGSVEHIYPKSFDDSSKYIKKVPTKSNKLALGVREYLYDFSEKFNAYTYEDFVDPDNWKSGVTQAIYDPEMEIIVNLDGIDDPNMAIQRAASGYCRATEWELFEIYQSKNEWWKITWYKSGEVVPNPFEY